MKNLNHWLRKNPQPFAVLALVDGSEKRIELSGGGRQWRDLTKTVEALNASKLTAVDKAGSVLRCLELDVADEDDDKAPVAESETSSEIKVFAKLIAEAYDKGGKSYEPLLNNAMTFIERQGQRLAKLEAELERSRLHIHKLNGVIAEMNAEPVEPESEGGVLGTLVAGFAQAQAAQAQQARPVRAVPPEAKPKEGAK